MRAGLHVALRGHFVLIFVHRVEKSHSQAVRKLSEDDDECTNEKTNKLRNRT